MVLIKLTIPSSSYAEILYQTGWEYGGTGSSEAAVEDANNPYGRMNELGSPDYADGIVVTDSCFDGSNCLRIDWEYNASSGGDWDLSTPTIMAGPPAVHDYYIGFAIRLDDGNVTGGSNIWQNNTSGETGRKMIYRTGGEASSLLHMGVKGDGYCNSSYDLANLTRAVFWVKNKSDTCDDWHSQPCGEKLYPGGPRCDTYENVNDCYPWPGCADISVANYSLESDGQWHTVIIHVVESNTDGEYEMWLDGVKILDVDKNSWDSAYTSYHNDGPCPTEDWDDQGGCSTRPTNCNAATNYDGSTKMFDNSEADFLGFKFPTTYNDGPPNHDQSEWWDNFIVATTYAEVESYLGGQTEFYVAESEAGDGNGNGYANRMSLTTYGNTSFDPGDTIYLCDRIDGQVVVSDSGSAGNNIVYDGSCEANPDGNVWGPVATLDNSWTQIDGGSMYYRTITDGGSEWWMGQVYQDGDADAEPDDGEALTFIRGEDHVTQRTRNGRFKTCSGCTVNDAVTDDFGAWCENGDIYSETDSVLEIMGHDTIVEVSHDGSNGYIRFPDEGTAPCAGGTNISDFKPTNNTYIFMSWAAKVGGAGDVASVGVKDQDSGDWLTDTDNDGTNDEYTDGVYQIWGGSQNTVDAWDVTTTTWTRKYAIWKTNSTLNNEYWVFFSASANDNVYFADIAIIELNLSTGQYFAHAGIYEASGADRSDMFLVVHDSATPSTDEFMYQNTIAAIEADDREYVEFKNLTINGGFIAENSTETQKNTILFNNNIVNYGGSSSQGPSGRFGRGLGRWYGAVHIGYDCGDGDCATESANQSVYTNVVINNNIIDESLGPAIRLYRVASNTNEIYRNTVTNFAHTNIPWPGAMYSTRVEDIDVYFNEVHTSQVNGATAVGGEKTNGIWFDGIAPYASDTIEVRHNVVYNISGTAFYYEAVNNGDVWGNLGYNMLWCMKHGGQQDSDSINWYNNTCAEVNLTVAGNDADEQDNSPETEAAGFLGSDQNSGTTNIRNNIIELTSDESDAYYVYLTTAMDGTVNISNNRYNRSGGAASNTRWAHEGTGYTLANFQTQAGEPDGNSGKEASTFGAIGWYTGGGFGEGSFTSYALGSGSACIDAGYTIGNDYDDAPTDASTWTGSVTLLEQGTQGTGWEIGMYIYQPSGEPPVLKRLGGPVTVKGPVTIK